MTLPNGPDGVDTSKGFYLVSAAGNGDQSIAELVGNDEATVKAAYKDRYFGSPDSVWGNPLGPLGQLFSGVSGGIEALIMKPLRQLVTLLVGLLAPFPIIGDVAHDLAAAFGLLNQQANTGIETGQQAQYSADTANAGVALLNAKTAGTGTVFTDTFNRPAAGDLGPDYDRTMSSGPGSWGPDGSGNLVWGATGAVQQTCIDRVHSNMTTKYQSIAVVLTNPPAQGQAGADSRIRLSLRCNVAKDTYVSGVIGPGYCEIGYVNTGTYTRIGASVGVPMNNGDLWEFRAGTSSDQYEFVLLQNNLTVCNRADFGHSSQLGSDPSTWTTDYCNGALIADAGIAVFGFITFQIGAPTVQVLTVADRTP